MKSLNFALRYSTNITISCYTRRYVQTITSVSLAPPSLITIESCVSFTREQNKPIYNLRIHYQIKMLNVQISTAFGTKQILTTDTPLEIAKLRDQFQVLTTNCYIIHNGKLVDENVICYNGCISIVPRLLGGKGGFGSMLRAIGAQIEKTTNREACRDLSGRRLRDINEEKRLKTWIEKQGKREEEAAERKKKKLERLCTEPKHEFKDQTYERERSALTERVGDAIEEGFKIATCSNKRKHDEEFKPSKKKMLLDLDIDSDELNSSDESDEDENKPKKATKLLESLSNDSGHSSDESGETTQNKTETEVKYPETNFNTENSSKTSNSIENEINASEYININL